MTDVNRILAEKVMGWMGGCNLYIEILSHSYLEEPQYNTVMDIADWHPTTDTAQVMECAEKLDKEGMDYEIMSDRYSKEVRVWSPSKNLWFRKGWKSIADLPRNICLAFYEAMKGGEK